MKTITDFTSIKNSEYNELRAEIKEALEKIAKKHGISMDAGKISVAPGFATLILNMAITTNGEKETKEAMYFRQFGHLYGFDKTDLFKTVYISAREYKIIGMKAKRGDEMVLVRANDAKCYLMPVDITLHSLGKKRSETAPLRYEP